MSPLVIGGLVAGAGFVALIAVGGMFLLGGAGSGKEQPGTSGAGGLSKSLGPPPEPPASMPPPVVAPSPVPVAVPEPPKPAENVGGLPRPPKPVEPARDETPAETIKRIKEAAVFLKVQIGQQGGTGSGFVIQVDGNTALIATNHHVISGGKDDDEPESGVPAPVVTVVFRSGGGASEFAAPATIIATDRIGNRDLAILRVQGVPNLPKPIALHPEAEVVETMPVLIFGFPFGEIDKMLTRSNVSPAITINKGSISSLRRDDVGEVTYVQIDGSLNPGNSGGPVVDEKGRLIGVAVAQIRNTTIGFAVPARELTRMLAGRVGRMQLNLTVRQGDEYNLGIKARLIDPLKSLRLVRIHYVAAADAAKTTPGRDGNWPAMPNARSLDLILGSEQAAGQALPIATGRFQITAKTPAQRRLVIQTSHVDASSRTIYSAPEPFEVPETPGAAVAPGGPVQGEVILTFEKLAPLSNSKDCKADMDAKGITINVPATLHILSPELKTKNAPMMLGDVEGDFVARVKIPGDLRPGTEPVRKLPFTFQGAGLLIWQDANNYLRLERTARTAGPVLVHRLLLESCSNGKPNQPLYLNVPEGPLYLQIARLKGGIHCMFGPDGERFVLIRKLAVEFPEKVKVGISAANAAKKPFQARFEEFRVIKPQGKVEGVEEK